MSFFPPPKFGYLKLVQWHFFISKLNSFFFLFLRQVFHICIAISLRLSITYFYCALRKNNYSDKIYKYVQKRPVGVIILREEVEKDIAFNTAALLPRWRRLENQQSQLYLFHAISGGIYCNNFTIHFTVKCVIQLYNFWNIFCRPEFPVIMEKLNGLRMQWWQCMSQMSLCQPMRHNSIGWRRNSSLQIYFGD